LENPVAALLEAHRIAGAEQRVQQNVVGFEGGVGFQFAAPVAVFVLLGEKNFARAIDCGCDPAGQVIDLAKAKLRFEAKLKTRGVSSIRCVSLLRSNRRWGRLAIASTISGRQPEAHVLGHHFEFLHVAEAFAGKNFTTSSTRHSGAEAPAVSAIVFTPSSHSGRMSLEAVD
jgi:hypothetical protein